MARQRIVFLQTMILSPRFLFILSMHENLLRAALVTRDLRIVASAQQKFRVTDHAFDPAEVWYKMKRVVAACFDIGRTLPREIISCALVGDDSAWVVWQDRAGDVDSLGYFFDATVLPPDARIRVSRFRAQDAPLYGGTGRAWLLWNLSGAYVLPATELPQWNARVAQFGAEIVAPRVCDASDPEGFGAIRARSPFSDPLPIARVFAGRELLYESETIAPDEMLQRAAEKIFTQIA